MFDTLNKIFNTSNVCCDKQSTMSDKAKLSKVLREYHKKHRISYRAMAEKAGKDLSTSRISNIIGGNYGELKPPAIEALARLLDVEPTQIMAWHRGVETPKSAVYSSRMQAFINDFNNLTEPDQEFIMPHIEMLHGEIRKRLAAKTSVTSISTERIKGRKVMEAPNSDQQVLDLMAITDKVRAQGFDVDDDVVEAVIVGEASEADPSLVAVILTTAGIEAKEDRQSSDKISNGK
jgi:transcriptional regulator with XRE-family HTH domain